MAELPELVWCGASAPMVEGFLVGLGIAAVGLVFFPFGFRAARPASGPQSDHVRREAALRWGRRTSWLLAVLAAATIAGYLVIYVSASGKFCDARLSPFAARLVVVWMCVAGATALTLATSVGLRWRAQRN